MKASLWKRTGLPPAFGNVILVVCLALLLAPYFEGADFGPVKVPKLDPSLLKTLTWLGPTAFALVLFAHLRVWPAPSSSPPSATNHLPTSLFLKLGLSTSGPIPLALLFDGTPGQLLSHGMEQALGIPKAPPTDPERRIFWVQGHKFLDTSRTYAKQGVRTDDTLVLTDLEPVAAVEAFVLSLRIPNRADAHQEPSDD